MNIAFFLHDDDADKAKRASALVIIGFLIPFALPNMVAMFSNLGKVVYNLYYAIRNNEPPSAMASKPTPTVSPISVVHHRMAKAKIPKLSIPTSIPAPVSADVPTVGASSGGK